MTRLKHWHGFCPDHSLTSMWAPETIKGLRETADLLEKADAHNLEVEFDNELDRVLKIFAAESYATIDPDTAGKIDVLLSDDGQIKAVIDIRACFSCLDDFEAGYGADDYEDGHGEKIVKWADHLQALVDDLRKCAGR